jgi:gamma-glutamylcyclotransferase (GGCT)/AIG2-like uncharacterized protein YtfP
VPDALGRTHHANVTFTGRPEDRVPGTVFEITDDELVAADRYESGEAYSRVRAALASGRHAWVYLHTSGLAAPAHRPSGLRRADAGLSRGEPAVRRAGPRR